MLRELRNVIENDLIGVSLLIELLLVGVGHNTTNYLGDCVIELRMTTEVISFLWVLKRICHYY